MIKEIISQYLVNTGLLEIKTCHLSPRLNRQISEWERTKKKAFADVIAEAITGEITHPQHAGYSIGRDYKVKMLKRVTVDGSKLMAFDFYNDLLQSPLYKRADGIQGVYSACYDFSPKFLNDLDQHFAFNRNYNFLDLPQQAIPTVYDEMTYMKPNTAAIESAVSDTGNGLDIRERLYIWAIGEAAKQSGGVLYQYYNESRSGRLYTKGAFGLQSLSKAMREIVLDGYTCFDMNTAAYSILLSKVNNPSKYPTIKAYTEDRTKYRNQIAKDTGADIDDVKTCITALGLGSSISVSNNPVHTTKVDAPDWAIKKIKAHKFTQAFISELTKLRTEITDNCCNQRELDLLDAVKQDKIRDFYNKNGRYPRSVNYRGKFVSLYYQYYEMEALKAMRSITENKDDCLLLHDGLYTKTKKALMILRT
ncbi:hypothetical protein VII00023_08729 [Vibrio ichthyoenteri ATCC 700023]|uniref:Uncharacterized protein n=1 Tax=Vibrio ichthyoenteri ATCC 700023 TaxID=870968 RepID=F9S5P7_9VIBR|nr:hypothetical protein [Vibrio ichthyoenteri]EGU35576.1 hypothetical protein VII00023_08729 [Vibrio ichthyoenteri ATCC 700023]